MVRKLKQSFNAKFDLVYARKDEVLTAIQGWLVELNQVMEEESEERKPSFAFRWSLTENPELDLPKIVLDSLDVGSNKIDLRKCSVQKSFF